MIRNRALFVISAMGYSGLLCIGQAFAAGFPPLTGYEHTQKISTTYDKFKDVTSFEIFLAGVEVENKGIFNAVISYVDKGQKRNALTYNPEGNPERFLIGLISISPNGRFLKYYNTIIMIDGRRYPIKKEMITKDNEFKLGIAIQEMLIVATDLSFLLELANAKKVEFQIGLEEFAFSPLHLIGIRDYVARLGSDEATVAKMVEAKEVARSATMAREAEARAMESLRVKVAADAAAKVKRTERAIYDEYVGREQKAIRASKGMSRNRGIVYLKEQYDKTMTQLSDKHEISIGVLKALISRYNSEENRATQSGSRL